MTIVTGDNIFGTATWIVDPTLGRGTHTTIQSAVTEASSGDTIFVRPGTYTENITGKDGITITGYAGTEFGQLTHIVGKISLSSGTMRISSLALETNSDYALEATGTATIRCYKLNIEASDNDSISNSGSGLIDLRFCTGDVSTTGVRVCATSGGGTISFRYCNWGNSGGSTTTSTASTGEIICQNCSMPIAFTTSSTGQIKIENCFFDNAPVDVSTLTHNSSNKSHIYNSTINSGTASDVTITSGTVKIDQTRLLSTNANVITGAGTVEYGLFTSETSSALNPTSTASNYVFSRGISFNSGSDFLDAYDEGTFTPAIISTGTDPTVTYTTQDGVYTRIGNVVFCKFFIAINTYSGGTGNLQISGLPFTSANDTVGVRNGYITQGMAWQGGYTCPTISIGQNGTIITLVEAGANVNVTSTPVASLVGGDDMWAMFMYWV